MNRRDFLKYTSLASGCAIAPTMFQAAGAAPANTGKSGWREIEHVTTVALDPARGQSKIWFPIPTHVRLDHQTPIANSCRGNYSRVGIFREPVYGMESVYAEWSGLDAKVPMQLEVTSQVSVRDRVADLGKPNGQGDKMPDDVAFYLKGTPSSPTDGIVLATATKIAGSRRAAVDKAHAVYDWILDNGVRDPNTQGCGTGDVVAMLETGNISGKCAD